MRVYMAGPYTKGDVEQNVRNAIAAADEVALAGHNPYIPHLTHYWHAQPRDTRLSFSRAINKRGGVMAHFEVYQDDAGAYRWRMIADNGRIMADSAEGYDTKTNAKRAIKRFKELSGEAEIVEEIEN